MKAFLLSIYATLIKTHLKFLRKWSVTAPRGIADVATVSHVHHKERGYVYTKSSDSLNI